MWLTGGLLVLCLSFSSSEPWSPKPIADATMMLRSGSASCELRRAMVVRMRMDVRVSRDISVAL